jgi:excinuclease UvrABC nuclease subunit
MLSITNLQALPKASGIYKVVDAEGCVIYIGQAKNIHTRWNNGHHKLSDILAECGTNAFIQWVLVPGWLLNRAEFAAISFHQPKLNKKRPPVV